MTESQINIDKNLIFFNKFVSEENEHLKQTNPEFIKKVG